MTEAEKILHRAPSIAPFEIQMDADSTNEVWTDITTKMKHKEAWHVVGMQWQFVQKLAGGVLPLPGIAAAIVLHEVQVQRNLENQLLLPIWDREVLLTHTYLAGYITSGGAVTADSAVFEHKDSTITTAENLRVMFRSSIDNTALSVATVFLQGYIEYHLVSSPDDGRTKHGDQLRNL